MREAAKLYGVEPLITDDYLEVEAAIAELQPELVLGTQMERHIAKRLGIPCAVISAPVHVQDFPARYSPQMGFEGANVIFDTWVHPLMMGLEEHLLTCSATISNSTTRRAPSHLGHGEPRERTAVAAADAAAMRRAVVDRPRLGAGGREGADENPVLRPRQGAPQHRALRAGARPCARSPWRRCTMPKRISAADATPVRVVIVTMDSHLPARRRARAMRCARELPGLELDVHAADEWGSDPAALERCRADIARGDIVIATMLFLEDHIRAVLPALAARRDHCDAMVCCMSAGEVVKLTRLGRFSMSGEAVGAIALLKRLRGKRDGAGSERRRAR